MSTLRCDQCGRLFPRVSVKGPTPTYCSNTCRQRAYEKRRKWTPVPAKIGDIYIQHTETVDTTWVMTAKGWEQL